MNVCVTGVVPDTSAHCGLTLERERERETARKTDKVTLGTTEREKAISGRG